MTSQLKCKLTSFVCTAIRVFDDCIKRIAFTGSFTIAPLSTCSTSACFYRFTLKVFCDVNVLNII